MWRYLVFGYRLYHIVGLPTMLDFKYHAYVPDQYRHGIRSAVLHKAFSSDNIGRKIGAYFISEDRLAHGNSANRDCCMTEPDHAKHSNDYTPHAEMLLISNLARRGVRTEGGTLYTTLSPCSACASSIVAAGIERVVVGGDTPYGKDNPTWKSILNGHKILVDNQVEYLDFTLSLNVGKSLQHIHDSLALPYSERFGEFEAYDLVDDEISVLQGLTQVRIDNPEGLEILLSDKGAWYLSNHVKTREIFQQCLTS